MKYIFLNIIFMMGELAYLKYTGRTPERAIMVIFIAALVTMLLFINEKNYKKQDYLISAAAFCVCFCMSNIWNVNNAESYQISTEIQTKEFLATISEKQDDLYVWHVGDAAYAFSSNYEPIVGLGYGLFSNSVFSGGWPVPSPVLAHVANKYGNGYNLFQILAENENAYLVSMTYDSVELIENYIKEHYNANAQCSLVQELNGFYIYSFTQ